MKPASVRLGPGAGLDERQREAAEGLAEALIGDWEGMPTVAEAAVASVWIDEILAYRRDAEETVRGLLGAAAGVDPRAYLDELRASDEGSYSLLVAIVCGAYLMNPTVAERIGDPIQAARVVDPADFQSCLDDGLLEPVLERGPIYRPTPQ